MFFTGSSIQKCSLLHINFFRFIYMWWRILKITEMIYDFCFVECDNFVTKKNLLKLRYHLWTRLLWYSFFWWGSSTRIDFETEIINSIQISVSIKLRFWHSVPTGEKKKSSCKCFVEESSNRIEFEYDILHKHNYLLKKKHNATFRKITVIYFESFLTYLRSHSRFWYLTRPYRFWTESGAKTISIRLIRNYQLQERSQSFLWQMQRVCGKRWKNEREHCSVDRIAWSVWMLVLSTKDFVVSVEYFVPLRAS